MGQQQVPSGHVIAGRDGLSFLTYCFPAYWVDPVHPILLHTTLHARATPADPLRVLSLTAAAISTAPPPALADETAAASAEAAPSWLSYVLLLSPIILYGAFNLYRSQVNPRWARVCRS